jgi:hypothetical protein
MGAETKASKRGRFLLFSWTDGWFSPKSKLEIDMCLWKLELVVA